MEKVENPVFRVSRFEKEWETLAKSKGLRFLDALCCIFRPTFGCCAQQNAG